MFENYWNETHKKYVNNKIVYDNWLDDYKDVLNKCKNSVLDLGCGTGYSGQVIEEYGHHYTGLDISHEMLKIAKEDNGSVIEGDMGAYLPFRPNTFDFKSKCTN